MENIVSRVSKFTGIDNLTILDKNTLELKSSDSVNVVFGPLSSMYITFHDIMIIPENSESYLTIKIILNGYSTEFVTNEPINITQRPIEPYPTIELKFNTVSIHNKKYFYEGVICVSGGPCKINKFDQLIVDH